MKLDNFLVYTYGVTTALEKLGVVSRAVKQYRRARKILETGGDLFHGTHPSNLESILRTNELRPGKGAHGTGVYFWRDMPMLSYLRGPEYAGLSFPRKSVPPLRQPKYDPLPHVEEKLRNQMLVSEAPTPSPPGTLAPVALPADTTVIGPSADLKNLRKLIAARRYRQVEMPLFHQAEADWRASSLLGERVPEPKNLQKLLKRPITYPLARTGTPRDMEHFLEDYEAKTSLT